MSDLDILARLAMAALIGAGIGLDRELRGKPAGLRTHALVALGSALVMVTIIELNGGGGPDPLSRAIQGIISGVGFLGAGAILRARDRDEVSGLTTAASIWLVASLGIASGAGYWRAAGLALALALTLLVGGTYVERFLARRFKIRHNGRLPEDE